MFIYIFVRVIYILNSNLERKYLIIKSQILNYNRNVKLIFNIKLWAIKIGGNYDI